MADVYSFPVQSFLCIPNPYANKVNNTANMYVAICDVKHLPATLPMETNPRNQNLKTNVAKRIKDSLLETASPNFYLLNRGILLSAKEAEFNKENGLMTIVFDDLEVHGNVDGGHSYKTIIEHRDKLDVGQQYVKIEILTGIEDIFQSLAAARNTSVQVQDKSIAELENRFDLIKKALAKESYIDNVFFEENGDGDIDVGDMLAILMMFNISRFPGKEAFPTISYSGKKRCIDFYISDHKAYGETTANPYVRMASIMPDIFKLYDKIETSMSEFYRQKNPNGRYGAIKGVTVPKAENTFESKFYKSKLDVQTPRGFIYPILGSFRALVEDKDGRYQWKVNPYTILKKIGPELVDSTVSMSRSLGNNPQTAGKESNLWKTLYITVAFASMQ